TGVQTCALPIFDLDADRGWQRDVKPDAGSDPPLAGRCQETDLQRVAPRLSDHFDQLVVGSRGPRAVAEGAHRVVDYDRVAVAGGEVHVAQRLDPHGLDARGGMLDGALGGDKGSAPGKAEVVLVG